jgi:pimeloyl-ACP methyl ester carboxylesterase
MRSNKIARSISLVLALLGFVLALRAQAPTTTVQGKEPVIIIPGLTGSELINSKTGERVWYKSKRSKDDDLRLPISPTLRNHDNLVPGDIMRTIRVIKLLPETEIYERLINALETRGGYKEGKWKNPPSDGYQDTFYVFPYDWRLDNVENARLLLQQIDQLRRMLRKPNLKFNIIAHSMGGLIARYAAMYGNADIPAGALRPTWAGAKYFDKIFLLGTPNEGSVGTLNSLLNGFSYVGGGVNIPFVQNVDRFDVFTIPSAYQLLPHEGTLLAYDEKLQPINIDIYDPKTWEEYDWAIWQDSRFTKKLSALEQRNARPFFEAALARAKRFQGALDADGGVKIPVSFYRMGADCKETENALLIIRDEKNDKWRTIFKPGAFTAGDGTKLTEAQLKPVLLTMGDGVVTKSSLTGSTLAGHGIRISFSAVEDLYQCESHSKLVTNPEIQDKLLTILSGAAPK